MSGIYTPGISSRLSEAIISLTCTQQVSSSKPGHDSDYSEIFHNLIEPLTANASKVPSVRSQSHPL